MLHKEQQAEYRRLKAERKTRLELEDLMRKKAKAVLQEQKQVFLSHDDLLGLITKGWFDVPPYLRIIGIETVEGGWKIRLVESKYAT